MPEKIEELVRAALAEAQQVGDVPEFALEDCGIERPADTSHGEWTSTIALKSAKLAHCAPRQIAEGIAKHLETGDTIEKVEIAGPGFINFHLSVAAQNAVLAQARAQGMDFARSNVGGGLKTQVEFVSANPVGPLHVGHGRWAALGDSMCNVMQHAGYDVEREFWINDHGSQMNTFGNSISKRYMQLADIMATQGCDIDAARDFLAQDRDNFVQDEADEHPDSHPYMDEFTADLGHDSYGGTYIIDEAANFWKSDGDRWVNADAQERMLSFRERGYAKMLSDIKETCHDVRCDFDVWMSERTMYEKDWTGTSPVERAYDALDKMGYLYRTDDGALWFKSTEFDDDKDRVIQKSNGDYTYFSSDIAYHWNKFQRVDHVVDIWGADHHGYVARVRAVCDALGYPGRFEVSLGQLVNLLRNGKPVRMSKRKGTMITFRELIDEVGADAARYTLVSRSSSQTIDFDIEAVKEKSQSNPVYYVQYAHARSCNVDRNAAAAGVTTEGADLSLLDTEADGDLIAALAQYPSMVATAGDGRAPHRVAHYLEDLAGRYHKWYAAERVAPMALTDAEQRLPEAERAALEIAKNPEPARAAARLRLNDAARQVISNGLDLLGVTAPEKM